GSGAHRGGWGWGARRSRGPWAGGRRPVGRGEGQRLDPPIFSPATKAEQGHDESITFTEMAERVGEKLAATLRDRSLAIYERGRALAAEKGIIIADTKFEFGQLPDGTLLLIHAVLTPASPR